MDQDFDEYQAESLLRISLSNMEQDYDEYEAEQDYDQYKAYMSPQDYEEYKAYLNRQNERNLSLSMLRSDHRLEQFQHYQHLMDLSTQQNQHIMCLWNLHNDLRQDLLKHYECLQQRQCQQLYSGSQDTINQIFSRNIDRLVEQMTHCTGNRFVQWLLDVCDENQRQQIIERITSDLVWISCHPYGNFVVQKVIRTIQTGSQISMITSALKPGILTLIKNIYGYHVAVCCLDCLLPEYNQFLIEAITADFVEVAKHPLESFVLKKCLIHCDGELIFKAASGHWVEVANDKHGSLTLEKWLSLCDGQQMNHFLDGLKGGYVDLSMHKFGSHVARKCLECAGDEQITRIIQELIRNPRLDQIMQDRYGNYVIQVALKQSQLVEKGKRTQHLKLLNAIKELEPLLRKSPFGKIVLKTS